jgi:DNA-binding CsgD family transcriptional regulator
MKVRDANVPAEREFASSRFLQCAAGRLAIAEPSAHAQLVQAVSGIAGDRPGVQCGLETVFRRSVWRLSWCGLPRLPDQGFLASPPARLTLVLARNLTESSPVGGIEGFARLFGLTPAEARLCELLAEGMSLDRIAEATRVSKGTARQRLKSVFQKTSCHRQGQLVGLIARHLN